MFRCNVIHVTYNCILKICIRSRNLGYTSRLVIKSEVGRNFRTLYIHHGFSPRGGLTVAGDVVIFVAKEPHLIKNMGSIKSRIYYLLIDWILAKLEVCFRFVREIFYWLWWSNWCPREILTHSNYTPLRQMMLKGSSCCPFSCPVHGINKVGTKRDDSSRRIFLIVRA